MKLTNDSEKLICLMYKSYLEKRKSGLSKYVSNRFGSSKDIHSSLCPDWIFEDVEYICCELSRAKFIDSTYYDNIHCEIRISDTGFVYMENRFKSNLFEVADFISKFI